MGERKPCVTCGIYGRWYSDCPECGDEEGETVQVNRTTREDKARDPELIEVTPQEMIVVLREAVRERDAWKVRAERAEAERDAAIDGRRTAINLHERAEAALDKLQKALAKAPDPNIRGQEEK